MESEKNNFFMIKKNNWIAYVKISYVVSSLTRFKKKRLLLDDLNL